MQTIDHKRGEVEFRKKLATQHTSGDILLPDYYGKEEHDGILLKRMEETHRRMAELSGQGVTLSPFLELGAERCQRSLVLTNDFQAVGFAVDISYQQLRTAEHFASLFNKPVLPHRVCCDINHLPFKRDSFPFVFCYEFLHHFPSPEPILREVHDVLSDGYFFFDEESFRRPRIVLYRQKHKVYSSSYLARSKVARFLSMFFSEVPCDEREHGVLENDDISLGEWLASAAVFESRELVASSLEKRIRSRLGARVGFRNALNALLGGSVEGLCRKRRRVAATPPVDLLELLTCPECLARASSWASLEQPTLARRPDHLECPACRGKFPIVDGIMILFQRPLLRELYPELDATGKIECPDLTRKIPPA